MNPLPRPDWCDWPEIIHMHLRYSARREGAVIEAVRMENGVYMFSDETFDELRSRLHRPKLDRHVGWKGRAVYLA